MKILSAQQIKAWDAFTIREEPIASIDLMERAALAFTDWFCQKFPQQNQTIKIICGSGNNGGDGLAIARLLHYRFYEVVVYSCPVSEKPSPDFSTNLNRLPPHHSIIVHPIQTHDDFPRFSKNDLLIDALFGSGLNRPVEGLWADLIEHLNKQLARKIAVDIPSGLFADQSSRGAILQADYTFSFQLPKLAFFFPENEKHTGEWNFVSIGLHPAYIEEVKTNFYYVDQHLICQFLKKRNRFSHKGTFGHALLVMGSYGKVGAAILATRAALRSGTGLVTIHAPKCAYAILQMSVPEAMVDVDVHQTLFSGMENYAPYQAIGVGCGLGTNEITFEGLAHLLLNAQKPLVIDADALNLISQHPALFAAIPPGSILTPHPKEFSRLFGESANDFARSELQIKKARELQSYIILKGANTAIATPDGQCYFNSTGNPGMATGGSGDVLTGILTGLVAQGYPALEACLLGVYLHGLAGDLAVEKWKGMEALIASDLIDHLGDAFITLHSSTEKTRK